MLVLSRRKDEAIMLGDDIELVVLGIEGEQVRLGIRAPKSVDVFRKEVYLAIQSANKEASNSQIGPSDLSAIFAKSHRIEPDAK